MQLLYVITQTPPDTFSIFQHAYYHLQYLTMLPISFCLKSISTSWSRSIWTQALSPPERTQRPKPAGESWQLWPGLQGEGIPPGALPLLAAPQTGL